MFPKIHNIILDPDPNWAKILDPDQNSMYLDPTVLVWMYFIGYKTTLFWAFKISFCDAIVGIKYLVSVEYCAYKIIQQILPTEVRYCILR